MNSLMARKIKLFLTNRVAVTAMTNGKDNERENVVLIFSAKDWKYLMDNLDDKMAEKVS